MNEVATVIGLIVMALGEFIIIVFFLADIRSDLKILRRLQGVIEAIQDEIHKLDKRVVENSVDIKNIKEDCVIEKKYGGGAS